MGWSLKEKKKKNRFEQKEEQERIKGSVKGRFF